MRRALLKTLGGLALVAGVVAGCDRGGQAKKPVPSPAGPGATPPPATVAPSTGAPAYLLPDQYALPWVTIIETDEGNEIRVKIKEALSSIQMVKVPAGTVQMPMVDPDGRIIPGKMQTHQVKSFHIGKTELPWDVYQVWASRMDLSIDEAMRLQGQEVHPRPADTWSRPSKVYNDPSYGFGREGFPAISIHPHAAETFCKWLSVMTGQKYRLPTEAEWEYACRAGLLSNDPAAAKLDKVAWFLDNCINEETQLESTHACGEKAPNAFGLYDMLGNAGEWAKGIDGKWVLKGGSYMAVADEVNSRSRHLYDRDAMQMRDPQLPRSVWWLSDGPFAGFRVVREE